jgi:KUP system potassium uptake protein
MVGCLLLVLGFRSSSSLGAAYGIAVTGTMAVTSVLFYLVARYRWRWPVWRAGGLTALFLALDLAFLGANLVKVRAGGWVPLAIAAGVYILLSTWKRGTELMRQLLARASVPFEPFLDRLARVPPPRVAGTAVFLSATTEGVPPVLLHHLAHNKALHQNVILLTVQTADEPAVSDGDRVGSELLAPRFHRVCARYGFMETPDVPAVVDHCCGLGIAGGLADVSYYVGRRAAERSGADGEVAEAALRLPDPERPLGDGVLQDPARPRGRARRAGRALTAVRASGGGTRARPRRPAARAGPASARAGTSGAG